MTILAFLLTLALTAPSALAQEAEAPDGAIIDTAEVSGLSIDRLSPGLKQEIEALAGTPLSREILASLAARIEAEQPDRLAAVRSIPQPDQRARVVFLVGRLDDDSTLGENINARYVVESVELGGDAVDVSQALRDELQTLVGKRLDSREAERLSERLRADLPGFEVHRRIRRGSQRGRIRVVFELFKEPWIRLAPDRSKIVYHGTQNWSGVLDLPMSSSRAHHRVTAGFVFANKDDLVEEHSGFRLRAESRVLGTERLGASIEVTRMRQTWLAATRSALARGEGATLPSLYRTRLTVEPTATFAFSPSVRASAGLSISELDLEGPGAGTQMANAWTFGLSADHVWRHTSGRRQRASASYHLRAAVEPLDSDLSYRRHSWQARYQLDHHRTTVLTSFAAGYIEGTAPLFERFTLGDSSTLRGWNKYDITPLGGARMFHHSVEYRYSGVAVFFDSGSVWEADRSSTLRYSAGFGVHNDGGFITLGFPLNDDRGGVTFMVGVRF